MTEGLDDFLNGSEAEVIEPETAAIEPEAVVEPEKAPVRDDKGRFAPKGETEPQAEPAAPAAPPAAEEPQHSIPPKALQEERRKRQELEQQLAELRQMVQQAQPQPEAPSIFEDEQGWQQNFGSQVVSSAVQQATLNARLDMSEMMVRQSHPDFEDRKAQFLELMAATPGLQQKALSDPHPWNFAYQYVASHQRMQELSATNVADLEAKLREQIKAEMTQQPAPSIPDSLADAQSARSSAAAPQAPPTLDQILGRK